MDVTANTLLTVLWWPRGSSSSPFTERLVPGAECFINFSFNHYCNILSLKIMHNHTLYCPGLPISLHFSLKQISIKKKKTLENNFKNELRSYFEMFWLFFLNLCFAHTHARARELFSGSLQRSRLWKILQF